MGHASTDIQYPAEGWPQGGTHKRQATSLNTDTSAGWNACPIPPSHWCWSQPDPIPWLVCLLYRVCEYVCVCENKNLRIEINLVLLISLCKYTLDFKSFGGVALFLWLLHSCIPLWWLTSTLIHSSLCFWKANQIFLRGFFPFFKEIHR